MKIGDFNIVNSECEKLTFKSYVSDLGKNSSQKINALARVAPFMSISKRRVLILFSNYSLPPALLYGCVTVELINTKKKRPP